MRPGEAVTARRCLRRASVDDKEEQRERGSAVDCLPELWRSALKAKIEGLGAAILALTAEVTSRKGSPQANSMVMLAPGAQLARMPK